MCGMDPGIEACISIVRNLYCISSLNNSLPPSLLPSLFLSFPPSFPPSFFLSLPPSLPPSLPLQLYLVDKTDHSWWSMRGDGGKVGLVPVNYIDKAENVKLENVKLENGPAAQVNGKSDAQVSSE